MAIGLTVFADGSSQFDFAVHEVLKPNTQIVIVGEDHKNPGLAVGILDLLKSALRYQNFNCLFLEISGDLEGLLNEAIMRENIKDFSLIISETNTRLYVNSYRKIGYRDDQLASIETYFRSHQADPLVNYPFNKETLAFLNRNKISVIAYDEDSNGIEIQNTSYFQIVDKLYPHDSRRDVESMRNSNVRSSLMAQKITESFRTKKCEKGIVVVGYAHLYSALYFNLNFGSGLPLKPIQDILAQQKFEVKVLLAGRSKTDTKTNLSLMSDTQNRFSHFAGNLFSHE